MRAGTSVGVLSAGILLAACSSPQGPYPAREIKLIVQAAQGHNLSETDVLSALLGAAMNRGISRSMLDSKGFARLRDQGIRHHLIVGNHDFWGGRFLRDELSFSIHQTDFITEMNV